MAQVINYYDDNITFEEGPFVICNPLGNGWRIEVQTDEVKAILLDTSIYAFLRAEGFPEGKFNKKEDAAKLCDWLNSQVNKGRIVKHVKGYWHCPEWSDKEEKR